mmetsp:Transcript_6573/g.11425  ORF Transcript_6573/g.11425 Transcript_6573/m.11425 type:complete len:204 (+) Transcript_6573:70-681(+)
MSDDAQRLSQVRKRWLVAASRSGLSALSACPEELRKDRAFVMAVVSQDGDALHFASPELRSDRQVAMAAVSNRGWALEWVAAELRSDRHVVMAAVAQDKHALTYAGDDLLEDVSFAVEARQRFYFFKITTLAGRSCTLACKNPGDFKLLQLACQKLGMEYTANETLLYGAEVVPQDVTVENWPGSPTRGSALVEYQLVKSQQP